jgi:4a-hydroxytetrahydrobiopterin dehydratase
MKSVPLNGAEIEHALTHLQGWVWESDALVKTMEFGDFREAMGFMLRAGFEADALDHHPEWTNVYNKVVVRLSTHDAGGKVTAKDVELAGRMDKLLII